MAVRVQLAARIGAELDTSPSPVADFIRAVLAGVRERRLAMTVREQLAEAVAEARADWGRTPAPAWGLRIETVELEYRSPSLPVAAIRSYVGRVNASETCGAPAGHLLFNGSRIERDDSGGTVMHRIAVRLLLCEAPWNSLLDLSNLLGLPYLPADFDELLDALDPAPGTWRDREPLL